MHVKSKKHDREIETQAETKYKMLSTLNYCLSTTKPTAKYVHKMLKILRAKHKMKNMYTKLRLCTVHKKRDFT